MVYSYWGLHCDTLINSNQFNKILIKNYFLRSIERENSCINKAINFDKNKNVIIEDNDTLLAI